MKRTSICFYLLLLLIMGSVSITARETKGSTPLAKKIDRFLHPAEYPNYTMVSAHRGSWKKYPENSLVAIQQSISDDLDVIEIDIKISKDGIMYLMHDDYIFRTTNASYGTGKYNSYTMAQLKKFTLKDRYQNEFAGQHPMTLQEILVYCSGRNIILNLDTGNHPELLDEAMDVVVGLDDEYKTLNFVIFKSRFTREEFVKTYLPHIPKKKRSRLLYMPKLPRPGESVPKPIRAFYHDWMNVPYVRAFEYRLWEPNDEMESVIRTIKRSGKRVQIYSRVPDALRGYFNGGKAHDWCCTTGVDGRGDWDFITAPNGDATAGTDMIITDRPYLLIQYLTVIGKRSLNRNRSLN